MELEKENNLIKKIDALTDDLTTLEKYIKDLFSFSPLPICFISPIGLVLEANPAFEKIFGKTSDEIVGEPVEKFFEKTEIEDFLAETLEKGFLDGKESFFKKSDQEKIVVNLFGKTRKNEDQEIIGYFVGVFDLTQVKRNENDLRDTKQALINILEDTEDSRRIIEEEKNKTATVISNFTDGLIVLNEDSTISLINPKALIMFNLLQRESIGKSLKEMKSNENFKSLAVILLSTSREIFREEFKIKENLVVEVSTVDIIRESASLKKTKLGTLVILHDITREKIIEKMKTEFVSISAHQLRTPLSAIKWTLQMLLEGDLGKISKEQREFIEKINISNERMILLINDLLNVARIEEGRYVYQTELVDIEMLVNSVIKLYKDSAFRKNIAIEFKNSVAKIPKLKIDSEKINLAVSNLVDNAIKYTPEGGKIVVSLHKKEKEIEISVKDSGIGIPEIQKERMFGKFFRATNAMKSQTEGSGLGNFIVKNIIEAHNGKAWFESEEGKGSTFFISLPINS